jgi:hypothetical protein
MGCKASKSTPFDMVDDSVNMVLYQDENEAKKEGKHLSTFVPRADHPLLQNGKNEASGSSRSLR